jgi:hypothetical protein
MAIPPYTWLIGQVGPLRWLFEVLVRYRPWLVLAVVVGLVLLILRGLWRRVARRVRRLRSPRIHPQLQKYSIDHAELNRKRREQALTIVATSTSSRLAGFRLVRQVEAIFVEGYRMPEEALTALKAAAAERGANGVLNVKTERTAAGRCTASGDAVVIAFLEQSAKTGRRSAASPQSPPPAPPAAPEPPGRRD